jgi:hypothetical protein
MFESILLALNIIAGSVFILFSFKYSSIPSSEKSFVSTSIAEREGMSFN